MEGTEEGLESSFNEMAVEEEEEEEKEETEDVNSRASTDLVDMTGTATDEEVTKLVGEAGREEFE